MPLATSPAQGDGATLSLKVVQDVDHPWPTLEGMHRLGWEWAGARLFLDLPESALADWMSGALSGALAESSAKSPAQEADVGAAGTPGLTWADLPPVWLDAAREQALSWLTDSLTAAGRGHARYVSADPQPQGRPSGTAHMLAVTLQFSPQGDQVHAILHADSLGLIHVASLVERAAAHLSPAPTDEPALSQVPVLLRLTLGTSDVPADQFHGLERGDVVFVTHPFLNASRQLMLRTDPLQGQCWSVAAHLDDHHLTVAGAPILMNDTSPPPSADATGSALDTEAVPEEASAHSVPIRLSFDLGHKVVPWVELTQLQPGDTLTLDRPAQQYVSIRANGALIGKGHLVDLDNRLGVSIDELHAPRSSAEPEGQA
ncbi:MAG: YscQ/HrcQ family type III secretion apparatus protein [Betaproteobacteria bacterium]|nr:YscQ/HrcQ family type III secretion apparatus protein [Betaproteobacteria bacterium]